MAKKRNTYKGGMRMVKGYHTHRSGYYVTVHPYLRHFAHKRKK
ncbi:MAG: hypothetical protein QXH07_06130 [Thermoplasmata archaeon]